MLQFICGPIQADAAIPSATRAFFRAGRPVLIQHLRMRLATVSRTALIVVGLANFTVGVAISSANGAEPARLMLVNSFAAGTSPFAPFNSAFREHMLHAWPAGIAFYEVSLDGWRPGVRENEDAPVQLLRSRFDDLHIDLVVARGARAGQFHVKYRDELFPDVPLLMTGDEASSASAGLRSGDSFLRDVPLSRSFRAAPQ